MTASYKDPNAAGGSAGMGMGSIMEYLPFLNIETTGVKSGDRQASFGMVRPFNLAFVHLMAVQVGQKKILRPRDTLLLNTDWLRGACA